MKKPSRDSVTNMSEVPRADLEGMLHTLEKVANHPRVPKFLGKTAAIVAKVNRSASNNVDRVVRFGSRTGHPVDWATRVQEKIHGRPIPLVASGQQRIERQLIALNYEAVLQAAYDGSQEQDGPNIKVSRWRKQDPESFMQHALVFDEYQQHLLVGFTEGGMTERDASSRVAEMITAEPWKAIDDATRWNVIRQNEGQN